MKSQIAVLGLAAALLGLPGFSQPAKLPRINPATGLPATRPGVLTPEGAITESYEVAREVHELIFNRKFDEALRRCLAFHNKWQTSASLIPLLGDWVELGRRYPKAKAALLEIRDHDVREFSEGRGYFDLFQEVSSINSYLQEEEATYVLFKSFQEKDPKLAQQCYLVVEGMLAARGEYQYCYDHMGSPQAKFDGLVRDLNVRREQYKRSAEQAEKTRQRIAEHARQQGWTNQLSDSRSFDPQAMLADHAHNTFVGQTRQIIEILVGTGHKEEAERVRDQALKVLDDARLKTAVADAVNHMHK